jgi:Cu-Zn family superoxide dismutase
LDVVARIEGLVAGSKHGFHIHQFGDISAADGSSTGSHFNPKSANHGVPNNDNRHAGDLGNIQFYDDAGIAWYSDSIKVDRT